jgi:hypothetical protein
MHDHVRAAGRERTCGRAADAVGRTRDEDDSFTHGANMTHALVFVASTSASPAWGVLIE